MVATALFHELFANQDASHEMEIRNLCSLQPHPPHTPITCYHSIAKTLRTPSNLYSYLISLFVPIPHEDHPSRHVAYITSYRPSPIPLLSSPCRRISRVASHQALRSASRPRTTPEHKHSTHYLQPLRRNYISRYLDTRRNRTWHWRFPVDGR